MIPGLVFLFAWELVVYLPGNAPRLTITGYLRSLVSHHPAQAGMTGLFQPAVIPPGESLLTLVALSLVLLAAALAAFSRREYVVEQ
jgi:hypothetical protein